MLIFIVLKIIFKIILPITLYMELVVRFFQKYIQKYISHFFLFLGSTFVFKKRTQYPSKLSHECVNSKDKTKGLSIKIQ